MNKILLPYRTVLLVPFFAAAGLATLAVFLGHGPARARRFFIHLCNAVLASE